MKQKQFDELRESIRQAGRIRRGEVRPSRRVTYSVADVKDIRATLGKSQSQFARMIGVSVATLRNWEQGRRYPRGPALALLRVAAVNPRVVEKALTAPPKRAA